jgi:hypothetical protein|tara:strand:- start:551 stop:742 length:192 start_codon:yes stop_codon:yes gene_type:complete
MAQAKKEISNKAEEYRNNKITAEYVNNKMENLMAALFDTIGENEERIKDLELQVWKLTEKLGG